jgi:hypothetical protein
VEALEEAIRTAADLLPCVPTLEVRMCDEEDMAKEEGMAEEEIHSSG